MGRLIWPFYGLRRRVEGEREYVDGMLFGVVGYRTWRRISREWRLTWLGRVTADVVPVLLALGTQEKADAALRTEIGVYAQTLAPEALMMTDRFALRRAWDAHIVHPHTSGASKFHRHTHVCFLHCGYFWEGGSTNSLRMRCLRIQHLLFLPSALSIQWPACATPFFGSVTVEASLLELLMTARTGQMKYGQCRSHVLLKSTCTWWRSLVTRSIALASGHV